MEMLRSKSLIKPIVSDSVDERKRDYQLRLWDAWRARDAAKFEKYLTEDVDKKVVEALLLNIISDFTQAGKIFATIVFEKDAHRKTFQTGKPLIRHVVERGNWPILEQLLSSHPNMRQLCEGGSTSLHYLCELDWGDNREMYGKCMTALLNQTETDVNALNDDELAPIDVAIASENREAIELLLKKSNGLFLDGVIPDRKSPRQRLLEKYQDLEDLLPPVAGNKITGSILSLMLKKGEEKEFCASFQIAMQDELLKSLLSNKKDEFLQQACEKNMRDAIKLLMDYGADPSYVDKWNDFRSSIIIAVEKGYLEILPLLLERASVPKYKNSHKEWIDVNQKDNDGNTALHHATNYGNETVMLEILKFGGYMGAENLKREIPLTRIPKDVLKQFLDRNIKTAKADSTHRDEITFKYSFLAQPSKILSNDNESQYQLDCFPEIKLLKEISKIEDLRPLLLHPVLASFTLLKWQRLKPIFTLNLVFYTFFTCFLTFNILWMSINGNGVLIPLRAIQLPFVIILLLREFFQFVANPKRYIQQFENYLEVCLILLAGFLALTDCTENATCRHVGACALLLAWFEFLLLIGKLPMFSVQVEMFLMVLSSFAKFISVYLIMILAFALSFFVLFNECSESCPGNEFSDIGGSIYKTLIMVSGEFDASDIPFPVYPITSHFIFILFVFIVSVVLLNLLNGLAVYDTQLIKTDALLHSYVTRIKYIASLEELILGVKSWSWLRIPAYFSDFEDKFNSEDYKEKDNFFYPYKMDQEILQLARETVKTNESEKKIREDDEKRVKAFSDSERRSETIDELSKAMKGLMKKTDFGTILKRLENIEKKLENLT